MPSGLLRYSSIAAHSKPCKVSEPICLWHSAVFVVVRFVLDSSTKKNEGIESTISVADPDLEI
jgi:hypothetical protein